jgi:hypothetical protein
VKPSRCVRCAALVLAPLILALLMVVLAVAACGGEDETTTTTKAETTTTKAQTSTTKADTGTTTEQLSTAETELPNGNIQATGYIDKVWEKSGKQYISIDYAELLTGQEADDAAGADVEYYIKNDNPQKREFEVSDTASITQFATDGPISWDTFMSYWSDSPPSTDADFPYDAATALWWIERDGQTVVKIDQQYLP